MNNFFLSFSLILQYGTLGARVFTYSINNQRCTLLLVRYTTHLYRAYAVPTAYLRFSTLSYRYFTDCNKMFMNTSNLFSMKLLFFSHSCQQSKGENNFKGSPQRNPIIIKTTIKRILFMSVTAAKSKEYLMAPQNVTAKLIQRANDLCFKRNMPRCVSAFYIQITFGTDIGN